MASPPPDSPLVAGLHARLVQKFELAEISLTLPKTRAMYRIYLPAAFDPLLDAAADDPEQNIPYWATTWPSGIALADVVLAEPGWLCEQRVLELGGGLGVTAVAALTAGARLIVTDYAPEALLLCRLNTLRNTGHEPDTLQLNWRQPPAALFELARTPFPVVLAADVLYESRDIEPLLELVERLVAPDGMLWLAEPGRLTARRFVEAIVARGWLDDVTLHTGPWPDPADARVVVSVHRLRRPHSEGGPDGPLRL